jgi:Tol biopolymer transport system component/serine/threonine protein kinase
MMNMTGQVFGDYRIESSLGSSGTGEVFRAVHVHNQRPAAVKVLPRQYAADPAFRVGYFETARAVSELMHPNIIDVLDFGEKHGHLYQVMEFVPDGSIRSLQQQIGPEESLPLYLSIDLMRQAAEGLACAHRHHVVHRNIKPHNLLLRRVVKSGDGGNTYQVKLSDFGLEPLEGDPTFADDAGIDTIAYMSPEQCQGSAHDGRGDIYSLGIVLFEITTGVLPFETMTPSDTAFNHIHTPPPSPRAIRPDIPEPLAAVITRCLAKDPAQRYSSADELVATLAALAPVDSLSAPMLEHQRAPEQQPVGHVRLSLDQNSVTVIPGQPAILNVTLANHGATSARAMLTIDGLAPDWIRLPPGVVDLPAGSQMNGPIHVLVPRTPAGIAGEYRPVIRVHIPGQLTSVSDARIHMIVQPFGATRLVLNPPVVTGRGRGTYQVTIQNLGNETRQITPAAAGARDDLRFHFTPAHLTLDPGQQATSRLTVRGRPPRFRGQREPHDFTVTASSAGNGNDDQTTSIKGTLLQQPQFPAWILPVFILFLVAGGTAFAVFRPDGTESPAAVGTTPTVQEDLTPVTGQQGPAAGETPETDGTPPQDAEPDGTTPTGAVEGVPPISLAEPLSLIAFATGRGDDPDGSLDIYVIEPDGSDPVGLITELGDDWSPAWSNDGTRIAWISKVTGHDEIHVANADGSGQVRLTNDPVDDRFPIWSPDDNWIIFARGHDNDTELYRISPDGGDPVRLTDNDAFDGNANWSPDGSLIAFTSNRTGSNEIFIMNSDGSDVRQLTDTGGNNFNPVWSPNGERILFVSDRDNDRDVYVINLDGSDETGLALDAADELSPIWSPDGSQIAFVRATENDEGDLFIIQADGSGERFVTSGIYTGDPNLTWSPDGALIGFLRQGDPSIDIYVVALENGNVTRLTTSPTFDGNMTWQVVSTPE